LKGEKMSKQRPVLVTTEFKGVFFGYLDGNISQESVKLKDARNCLYWPESNRGFLGLAEYGPQPGAKIGPPVDIQLFKITCVAEVKPNAEKLWLEAKW
jgi:hypothetical protein